MKMILPFLVLAFLVIACESRKDDHGINIGIRDANGDTLSFTYFPSGNSEFEFYDADRADSIFNDKTVLSKMPGKFLFGVKQKRGKPFRYLIFGKPRAPLTIGKNFSDVIPDLGNELPLSNYFVRVVDIRYDSTDKGVREDQLVGVLDKETNDTILYLEENYFIKDGGNIVGGTFAIFDNKERRRAMTVLCEDALKQAVNSMTKNPK